MSKKTKIELLIYVILLVFLFVWFRTVWMIGRIPSESMEPTYMVHDWTIGNRLAYRGDNEPKRGDTIIFYSHEFEMSMCKRVIGLPGEEITFVGGNVYVDGAPLDESSYLEPGIETLSKETFLVPENCYFVLGDNREISLDSREWDNPYIEKEDVQCRIFFNIPFHKLPWL